jgi:hypothetical protein
MATPAPDAVKRPVDRYDQDRKVILSGDYKEEQLRARLLSPFLESLGWDMDKPLTRFRSEIGEASLFPPDFFPTPTLMEGSSLDAWSLAPPGAGCLLPANSDGPNGA